MKWLLERSVRDTMDGLIRAGNAPSASDQREYRAQLDARRNTEGDPQILTRAGDVAEIDVSGVLTPKPDLFAFLFGGGNTTYQDIVSAVELAESDPEISRIEMVVDSPGGALDGMYGAMDAVAGARKNVTARVAGLAASAAYMLASQADSIIAESDGSMIGSVGVVQTMITPEDVHMITNRDSPAKRPDPRTDEGRGMIQDELDKIFDFTVAKIAEGRGVSEKKVKSDFGRGGLVLATEAESRGMIDSVQSARVSSMSASVGGERKPTQECGTMNLEELKAKHPELFAQAVKIGADSERDRVTAHLTMGKSSGDMNTAVKAIEDGAELTASLQAQYMTAAMNKGDQRAREEDDSETTSVVNGSAGAEGNKGEGDAEAVSLEVCNELGYTPETAEA